LLLFIFDLQINYLLKLHLIIRQLKQKYQKTHQKSLNQMSHLMLLWILMLRQNHPHLQTHQWGQRQLKYFQAQAYLQ
jgi:hypothetical protein